MKLPPYPWSPINGLVPMAREVLAALYDWNPEFMAPFACYLGRMMRYWQGEIQLDEELNKRPHRQLPEGYERSIPR